MGLVDGQLTPLRTNADDSIEEVFASPDPTITNFLVGASCRAHHLVAAIIDHLRTYDEDGVEVAQVLAQVTDNPRGDTTLNFANMVVQQIYTEVQLLRMPFAGYEESSDCQWRWEQVGFPWDMAQPEWDTAMHQETGIPEKVMISFLEKLKRFTVQIVAKCRPDIFGYDCRESWNTAAAYGPCMSPKSCQHYTDTAPLGREETMHRLMAWMKRVMCPHIPPTCNAMNTRRYRQPPSDEQMETYDISNPKTGILSDRHDAYDDGGLHHLPWHRRRGGVHEEDHASRGHSSLRDGRRDY